MGSILMKGMVFAGCSFTWGQGLWYYSDLPNIPKNEDYLLNTHTMSQVAHKLKDSIRFPRLVANHFSAVEIVKSPNGGSDAENLIFLNELFSQNKNYSHLTDIRLNYNEIDYIIYQVTQIHRSPYYFSHNDQNFAVFLNPNLTDKDRLYKLNNKNEFFRNSIELDKFDILYEYMIKNNLNFDDIQKGLLNFWIQKIKNQLMFYEKKGIKVKILFWPNELNHILLSDSWYQYNHIKLLYNNLEFETIDELQNYDKEKFVIFYDKSKKIESGRDLHPSKLCHEIIANSIIKSIEQDYE